MGDKKRGMAPYGLERRKGDKTNAVYRGADEAGL